MTQEFVHDVSDTKDAYKLLMAYDGSGRRISKTRMVKDDQRGYWYTDYVTHYTGIGTEVREVMRRSASPKTDVVVNMPQGLGRFGVEDASTSDIGFGAGYIPSTKFEWYLKNHLGSTMLEYGTQSTSRPDIFDQGGVQAAYDYRAFGEQVDLEQKGDKVTENFTGKERDDETELNYFGARYLDPMLGLWTSVDAARQYQNPYTYIGNNPICGIDEDGLWGFDVNVGFRAAVIVGGGVLFRWSFDSNDPSKNKAYISVSYGVGLEVGLPIKSKIVNAASKVSANTSRPDESTAGDHSEVDIGLGLFSGTFTDQQTTPSSLGFGTIGGGYYETQTVDMDDVMNNYIHSDFSEDNSGVFDDVVTDAD